MGPDLPALVCVGAVGSHNSGHFRGAVADTSPTQWVRWVRMGPVGPDGSGKASTWVRMGQEALQGWGPCVLPLAVLVLEVVQTGRVCTRPLSAV